jgi:hypothetical protein
MITITLATVTVAVMAAVVVNKPYYKNCNNSIALRLDSSNLLYNIIHRVTNRLAVCIKNIFLASSNELALRIAVLKSVAFITPD